MDAASLRRIRDGDPAALAALCERHAAAVLAFCEQVTTPGRAVAAAADAFADFRRSVAAADGLTADAADGLLRGVTCGAAARRGVNVIASPDGDADNDRCVGHETGLIDYVEGRLSTTAREQTGEHVARCRACTVALRRLEAARRAFARPPRAPLPASVVSELVTALVNAAPVRARGGDGRSVRAEALRLLAGDRVRATEPAARPAPIAAEQPRTRVRSRQDRRGGPRQGSLRRRPRWPAHNGRALWARRVRPRGATARSRDRAAAGWRALLAAMGPPAWRARARIGSSHDRPPRFSSLLTLLIGAAGTVTLAILMLSSYSDSTASRARSSPVYLGSSGERAPDDPAHARTVGELADALFGDPRDAEPPAAAGRSRRGTEAKRVRPDRTSRRGAPASRPEPAERTSGSTTSTEPRSSAPARRPAATASPPPSPQPSPSGVEPNRKQESRPKPASPGRGDEPPAGAPAPVPTPGAVAPLESTQSPPAASPTPPRSSVGARPKPG